MERQDCNVVQDDALDCHQKYDDLEMLELHENVVAHAIDLWAYVVHWGIWTRQNHRHDKILQYKPDEGFENLEKNTDPH